MPTKASPRTPETVAATAVCAADGAKLVEDLHAAFGKHHGSAVHAKGVIQDGTLVPTAAYGAQKAVRVIQGVQPMQANRIENDAKVISADHSAISNESLLLRELSHRVKNEFASAIGHVSLIASRSTNEDVKLALAGVADLLHRYAGVHRALQMPTYSTAIDASGYIRALCQSIQSARLDHKNVDLLLVAIPLRLRSEQCWKLGMIIAELIMNSMRHAFDDGGGTIQIQMSASGPFAHCCIMDNGVSRGPLQPGQGLTIVDALARDLNGMIDHQFGVGGATSILSFPINGEASRLTHDAWINPDDPAVEDAQISATATRLPPRRPPVTKAGEFDNRTE
jgi:two-component sensor histidine kinase